MHEDSEILPVSFLQKIDFLRSIPAFNELKQHSLEEISELLQKQKCHSGHIFFEQNDEVNALYFIESGHAIVVKNNIQIAKLGPRSIFGEMGIINERPRNASVVAEDDIEVYVLPGFLLKDLLKRDEKINDFFENVVSTRN